MQRWQTFITSLVGLSDINEHTVAACMGERELQAWIHRERLMRTPQQLVADLVTELNDFHAVLITEAVCGSNPQSVIWTVLRGAAREAAIKDATREALSARAIFKWQQGLRRWVDGDDDSDRCTA
jgi:hypothetical protein